MVWKVIKKGSKATYKGKRVKILEIVLDRALIKDLKTKQTKVVPFSSLRNIKPKPRG